MKTTAQFATVLIFAWMIILGVFLSVLTGCEIPAQELAEKPAPARIDLSWESEKLYGKRSGGQEWSDALVESIKRDMALYDAAKDTKRICPKYAALDESERIKAIGEFWVALAVFESSWNPKSAAVDVGKKENRDTWSVGLYQVSVVDKANREATKYNYDQLLEPVPNIKLATEIMRRQLKNYGLLILPNSSKGRYWAVILDGNKYSKIPEIIARMKKTTACF